MGTKCCDMESATETAASGVAEAEMSKSLARVGKTEEGRDWEVLRWRV
jgi:hypothetical protein